MTAIFQVDTYTGEGKGGPNPSEGVVVFQTLLPLTIIYDGPVLTIPYYTDNTKDSTEVNPVMVLDNPSQPNTSEPKASESNLSLTILIILYAEAL